MKIKAIDPIIEWDADAGRMAIVNAGESAEVSDKLGQAKIDAGAAKAVGTRRQLDHDDDGRAGGSKPGEKSTSALGEARKRYRAAFGKNAGSKWTVEQVEAKIAEKAGDTGDACDAPPVD